MELDLMKKILQYWNKPNHAAYLMVAPAVIVVCLFSIFSMIAAFFLSLFDVSTNLATWNFVGLGNFQEAFADERFIHSWAVTGLFTVFDVPINIGFSLLVAALVSGVGIRDKILRSCYILPLICSSTVIGIMWKLFLNPNVGWGIYSLSKLGFPRIAIFSDIDLAVYGIIFISIWRGFGMSAMILVAAMQGISTSLYEAATLDGANKWQQFRHVTLPGISSTLWFLLITRIIGSFQVFDLIYTITNGGPAHSTETVVSYIYSRAFQEGSELGYSTAMSLVLFGAILLVSVFLYGRMILQERRDGGN